MTAAVLGAVALALVFVFIIAVGALIGNILGRSSLLKAWIVTLAAAVLLLVLGANVISAVFLALVTWDKALLLSNLLNICPLAFALGVFLGNFRNNFRGLLDN